MARLDIVGTTEFAQMANVGRKTVDTWYRREIAPPPDAMLSMGPVWRRSTVERWLRGAGKKRVALVQKLGAS